VLVEPSSKRILLLTKNGVSEGLVKQFFAISFVPLAFQGPLYSQSRTPQLAGIVERRLQSFNGWQVQVENREKTPIVALHATFRCPSENNHGRSDVGFRYDALANNYGSDSPIGAGAFYAFSLSSQTATCPGGIDAVIFGDGHSVGDPTEVAEIYQRRVGAYEAVVLCREQVNRVASKSSKAIDASAELRARSMAVSQDPSKPGAEREGSMFAFSLVSAILDSQDEWQVPSDATVGNQNSIESTMRERGMPKEQAHAKVLVVKLDRWIADLESHLHPLPVK
jgi:hypothetical protein